MAPVARSAGVGARCPGRAGVVPSGPVSGVAASAGQGVWRMGGAGSLCAAMPGSQAYGVRAWRVTAGRGAPGRRRPAVGEFGGVEGVSRAIAAVRKAGVCRGRTGSSGIASAVVRTLSERARPRGTTEVCERGRVSAAPSAIGPGGRGRGGCARSWIRGRLPDRPPGCRALGPEGRRGAGARRPRRAGSVPGRLGGAECVPSPGGRVRGPLPRRRWRAAGRGCPRSVRAGVLPTRPPPTRGDRPGVGVECVPRPRRDLGGRFGGDAYVNRGGPARDGEARDGCRACGGVCAV